jgi:hypothetical protein
MELDPIIKRKQLRHLENSIGILMRRYIMICYKKYQRGLEKRLKVQRFNNGSQ